LAVRAALRRGCTGFVRARNAESLIAAATRVCHEDFGKTSAMTLPKKKAVN
jgi:hypothetical protein